MKKILRYYWNKLLIQLDELKPRNEVYIIDLSSKQMRDELYDTWEKTHITKKMSEQEILGELQ